MAKKSSKLVVKTHAPRRAALLWVLIAVLVGAAGYGMYEFGRHRGGFDRLQAFQEEGRLWKQIVELRSANTALREKIAMLETSKDIDSEAYSQVEQDLLELQKQLQQQREELAFYQGIVLPSDGVAGLRIQRFEVFRGPESSLYRVKLVLVQAIKHDRVVSGVVDLSVSGAKDGEPVSYALGELIPAGTDRSELKFRFRYFQDLEREVILPEGFLPNRVTVEVRPSQRSARILRESFAWEEQKT